jgi:hypothetical protein
MSFKLPNIISQCITCFFLFLFSFFLFLFNYYYYFYYFIRAPCVVVNYIWPKWIVLDHTNTIDYILCTTSFPSHSWTQKKKKIKKKKKKIWRMGHSTDSEMSWLCFSLFSLFSSCVPWRSWMLYKLLILWYKLTLSRI